MVTTFLVDSDRIIPFLKGRAAAREIIVSLDPLGMAISVVTYAEVSEGVDAGRARHEESAGWREFLQFVDVIPVDIEVAEQFASVRAELRASGMLIPDMDLLIAATALTHHLTLVTGNLRHFDRVPGLRIHPSP
ncbi:MAG: VapC toxin family PIN domain ribonuclease [Anaerolinea sp.]|nr:VapC toxin family PIN domain ribonuclease [Anaerolinea sp.]